MKTRFLFALSAAVLASATVGAQQRIAEPALEIARDVRLADQQTRDINELKQQIAATRQIQAVQQEQIVQLRACVKQLDAQLTRPLRQAGEGGERVQAPMDLATNCKL